MQLEAISELSLHFFKSRDARLNALFDCSLKHAELTQQKELIKLVNSFEKMEPHSLFQLVNCELSEDLVATEIVPALPLIPVEGFSCFNQSENPPSKSSDECSIINVNRRQLRQKQCNLVFFVVIQVLNDSLSLLPLTCV